MSRYGLGRWACSRRRVPASARVRPRGVLDAAEAARARGALANRTLALLFPHFAAEVGGRAGDVAEELAQLEKELADVLRLPETHCSSPDAVMERFLGALPSIREALLLDAQATATGIRPRTRSTR